MKQAIFQLAKKISKRSSSKIKLGAVITNKKNQVISVGYNDMRKTHPKCPTWGNFIHAELDSLIGLSFEETNKGSIYVYRETSNGQIAMSRPCSVCFQALKRAGVKKLFYTTNNGYKKEFF